MALGGATAPWLTAGFLLALWVTRRTTSLRQGSGFKIGTVAVYLVMWLLSYHLTFSIRELISIADAWREAAPWMLLTGPASVILGVVAAAAHKRDLAGDVSLALPLAWSTPELIAYSTEGWSMPSSSRPPRPFSRYCPSSQWVVGETVDPFACSLHTLRSH
jgi:hypothetical protein